MRRRGVAPGSAGGGSGRRSWETGSPDQRARSRASAPAWGGGKRGGGVARGGGGIGGGELARGAVAVGGARGRGEHEAALGVQQPPPADRRPGQQVHDPL